MASVIHALGLVCSSGLIKRHLKFHFNFNIYFHFANMQFTCVDVIFSTSVINITVFFCIYESALAFQENDF